jgi:phospholipase C
MRRRLASVLGALVVIASATAGATPAAAGTSDPAEKLATTTPIKHFMVLMQSSHSFDNYFGTYPGADGIPADTCMPVDTAAAAQGKAGASGAACVKPFKIGGKDVVDLGQSTDLYAAEYNGGKMNGFVSAFSKHQGAGGQAMGHYDDSDIPYYWNVADNYVLFDRLFTSAAGGSVWNHMYWISGTPGNPRGDELLPNGFDAVPTIFDRLQKAGVSWKFYAENLKPDISFRAPGDNPSELVRIPLLNFRRFLDDPALRSHIVDMTQYYKDVKEGTLPAVSFMASSGASEHPPGNIAGGERFIRSLVNALMSSSAWRSSAFMWTYDDWGGWYDHVKPPSVDKYGYGFRSPALLVSPYAKKGVVDHTTLDFTSELKFIENNWGVAPLAARDKAANDITSAFDFTAGPREAVILPRTRAAAPLALGRIGAVYPAYGLAVVVVATLVGFALHRRRRLTAGVAR